MAVTTSSARVLEHREELAELGEAWDRLALSRGVHADLYDTWCWHEAWLASPGPGPGRELRFPAVFEGDRLAGLLPLVEAAPGRWETAGFGSRPRVRPIVRGERPEPDHVDALVDAAARHGARSIALRWLTERDPATPMLLDALRRGGFHVSARTGGHECLAEVHGDWNEHRRQFKKYHRTVKNFANKASRLAPLALEVYAPPDRPIVSAMPLYLDLHRRGWKGAAKPEVEAHRRALFAGADARGWSRLYLLRAGEVPAAAIVWFRLGAVAVAFSTVYDRDLAALSPGTIAMWWAHERIFEEGTPRLVDYLPGEGPQKDQLATARDRVLIVDAVRRTSLAGWTAPIVEKARAAARRWARREAPPAPPPTAPERRAAGGSTPVAPVEVAEFAAAPLELDPAVELWLTVASGHASPKRMRETWREGDRWWSISRDGAPFAAARVGGGDPAGLVELVLVPGAGGETRAVERALGALAAVVDRPLVRPAAFDPIVARFPWPQAPGR